MMEDVTEVAIIPEAVPPLAAVVPEVRAAPLLDAAGARYREVFGLLAKGVEGLVEVEFVHDLRVASRRLGEVARLLGGFMDKPTARAVEASLKGLRRAMGDLRDADVTCEHLLKWRMPAAVKGVARALAEELAGRRRELEEAGRAQMTSASVSGAMVVLARVLEDQAKPECVVEAQRRLETVVAGQAKKRERAMQRAFGRAARRQTPEALHEARISVKKLRYILELMQDAGGKRGLKKQIGELKKLQQVLGEHHDVHVIVAGLEAKVRGVEGPSRRKLGVAWRKWHREMERGQAKRAGEFFVRSYGWMNG